MLRHYVARVVDLNAPENPEDRHEMVRLIKHLAANSVFYCFQGQITIFLISFFGRNVSSVAEVGALGRLAMIFAILANLMTNIFVPAFARCHNPRKLRWLYAGIIGSVAAFSLLILAGAALFPNQFLFVLGNKYAHLHRELILMVGGAVLSALTGAFWSLNASKAWVAGAWLYIPLTLVTQVALIPFTDFSSVGGVLTFNILSAVPNLLLNLAMSYRGLHSFAAATHRNAELRLSFCAHKGKRDPETVSRISPLDHSLPSQSTAQDRHRRFRVLEVKRCCPSKSHRSVPFFDTLGVRKVSPLFRTGRIRRRAFVCLNMSILP